MLQVRRRSVKLFAILLTLFLWYGRGDAAPKKPPCAPDLASCPMHGCAESGSHEATGSNPVSSTNFR